MNIVFYHNPRCSKSLAVQALLQEKELTYKTVEYLNEPPSKTDLIELLDALDLPPHALLRSGDSDFKALKLDAQDLDQDQVVDLLLQHPKWFQRPVVVVDGQARIGRPIENIESILP
ncbi:MAG: arsenate reductase (glutaredoxin) [Gammaproteobacteria bacterium]